MISIQEQIAEVKREIAMRERLYPQWVDKGTLDAKGATQKLEAMRAVLSTLQEVEKSTRLI